MQEIKKWYEEVILCQRPHQRYDSEYIIYKGFKITKLNDTFTLKDVRWSNFYNDVSKTNLNILRKHGFIKGVDIIGYKRDVKRIKSYKKRITRLYDKRKIFKKQMDEDRRLNTKRIRNINLRIDDYVSFIFFYQVRVNQFKIKYYEV